MPIDFSALPISPGVVLGAGLYAVVSVFGTGQMVSEREIAILGWSAMCEADVRAEISATAAPPPVSAVLELTCTNTFGAFFGRDGEGFCQAYGNFDIPIPGANALREQERRLRDAEERRLARAASQVGSRCDCASALYQAENRVPLAVYAGSARAVTPPEVRNLTSELTRALRSPHCTDA